jgi:hypothetical protein
MTTLRRGHGDDGTAAIEGAIVAPAIFVLFLGMFEFGLVFRDYLSVGDAVADAAKYASIQGNKDVSGASADYTAVSLIRQDLANLPPQSIDRIVIFKGGPPASGTPLQQMPTVCKTATSSVASANCNIYLIPTAFIQIEAGNNAYFLCVTKPTDPACAWDPEGTDASGNKVRADGPHVADISYVGVYIKVNHQMITRLWGSSFTLEMAAVQRLEPGQLTA